MPDISFKDRDQLDAHLVEKSLKDDKFRKRLLANPKAALEEVLKTKIPANVKIEVLVETPDQFYIVMPPGIRASVTDELTDRELEQVAGGGSAISNVNYFTDGVCAGS